ncbi:phytanoyl-CoA dioxygenase [Trypanosoma rangeli]|uniref:Phytanoyl-CoA dioxygenase n=1 Tax=Trypanosoma rangeli TaxID=5698 RepID=A0A422NSQ3_TRYRA|nr:phytanoyl-CoA dioxygenase [Trypanosoma rangeli]RNF08497.1 phytanoyl-CoA dioxygenase [Trypanosoma rangeli]|eukprot:RNF08497.1 phytanoyl-CoA dioxygenase [Trypanosoma rangeli]
MRKCVIKRHGRLKFPLGTSFLTLGHDLHAMVPSNELYYDPPKLRHRLDKDGYLYFKNIIPRVVLDTAIDDLGNQMLQCGWTRAEDRAEQMSRDGVTLGVPFPSTGKLPPPQIKYTDSLRSAVSGTNVMALVRQVFGDAVNVTDVQSLHLAAPQETFGLRMSSVYLNKGTKLALVVLVPLHDIPFQMGTPVVVKGSNSTESYMMLRSTYGQHEVESGNIRGDGCYTHDPQELLPLGKQAGIDEVTGRTITIDVNPFVSTTFEVGDVLLLTVYTMYAFLTNTTNAWRIMAEAVWTMEGDDVGPDPRYVGADAPGLSSWYANRDDPVKYTQTMDEAKRAWGLLPSVPPEV